MLIIKVAHIKSPFLGLSETFVYNYIKGLKSFETHVITETHINSDQFPFKKITVHRDSNKWYDSLLHFSRSWLAGKIQSEIIFNSFYFRSLKKINPDIVHFHFGK